MHKLLINNGKNDVDIARIHFASFESEERKAKRDRFRKARQEVGEGLVYATLYDIFMYVDGKNDIPIGKKRRNIITDLNFGGGRILVATTNGKVCTAFAESQLVKRNKAVYAMCNHEGTLYDAGEYNQVIRSFGSILPKVERVSSVRALCSHNDILYDGTNNGYIYETSSDKEIAYRGIAIRALCSHKGKMYDGGNHCKIYETLKGKNGKPIARRDTWTIALCSHNGRLYDAGGYGIYDTLTNKPILTGMDKEIDALCSVPDYAVEEIKREHAKSTNK